MTVDAWHCGIHCNYLPPSGSICVSCAFNTVRLCTLDLVPWLTLEYEFFHMRSSGCNDCSFSGLDVLAHTVTSCTNKKVSDSLFPNLVLSAIDNVFSLLRRAAIQALTCGFTMAIFTTIMSISIFVFWSCARIQFWHLSSVINYYGKVFYSFFAVLGRVYSLTVLITLMLLKITNASDSSSSRVNGDLDSSDPVILGPIR